MTKAVAARLAMPPDAPSKVQPEPEPVIANLHGNAVKGQSPLKILMLEDEPADAELMTRALTKAAMDFTAKRVDTREAFVDALETFAPDVLLLDCNLPGYDGAEALAHERRVHPEIPVVVVTGTIGDEAAVEWLKAGAKDYVLKSNLVRLPSAIERVIAVEEGIRARKSAERAVRESEAKFRSVVEQNVAGIAIIRDDGAIAYVNPYFAHLVGSTPPELIGRRLLDFVPEDEKAAVVQQLGAQLSSKAPFVQHQSGITARDGHRIEVLINASQSTFEGRPASIAVVIDITERRVAEAALYELRRITDGILNSIPVRVFWKDKNLRYLGCNAALARDAGFAEPKDLVGKDDFQMGWRDQAELYRANDRKVIESGCPELLIEEPQTSPTGETLTLLTSKIPLRSVTGEIEGVLGTYMDITDRKRAERALREEEMKFRGLVEQELAGIYIIAADGTLAYVNPYFAKMFGYAPEEVIGRPVLEFVAGPEKEAAREQIAAQISGQQASVQSVTKLLRKDGTPVDVLAHGSLATYQGRPASIGVVLDISERTKAERQLAESELKLRTILEAAGEGILVADVEARNFVLANRAICEMLGYRSEELLGLGVRDIHPPDALPSAERHFARIAAGESCVTIELPLKRKDASVFAASITASPVTLEGRLCAVGIFSDITERKRAERALSRLNRIMKTLSSGNEALVRATSETELLNEMCRVIVETGGYRIAWIGVPQLDGEKSVKPVAWAGPAAEYFARSPKITWGDSPTGRGICGRAIRSGEPQTSQNSRTDPGMAPWSAGFEEYGLASAAGLPLKDDSGVFAVLAIYATEPDAFDADELKLLQELASDLAFGIRSLREHTARETLDRRWRASLEATVGAIASTVEMRDPYTSGQELRVAKLATAIAHRLSMSEHDVHGIYLAGIIHDVGKINVPAEILNRPGKLSKIEFQLIQEHPQAGYDIVKGVDFPWPIAQMVLQHHERLDGSGYPQGIKGGAMLREAKILAVADVVEAMMSHRPYRPALGIDAALAEIETNKGRLFDPEAVDACVALFREDGFHFD